VRPVIEAWRKLSKVSSRDALMLPTFGRGERIGQAVPRWGKNFLRWRIRPVGGGPPQVPISAAYRQSENRRSSMQGGNTQSREPRLSWSPEEQDVAVRIANLEAAQTVVCILKRCAECCAMIGKFGGKRIGV